jgi:hypothetical protein
MDRRFDALEWKFELMDRKFEAMDQRWVPLNNHLQQDFLWSIAIQAATIGGLMTTMARGFHWL